MRSGYKILFENFLSSLEVVIFSERTILLHVVNLLPHFELILTYLLGIELLYPAFESFVSSRNAGGSICREVVHCKPQSVVPTPYRAVTNVTTE
jgi:hypothetical protein